MNNGKFLLTSDEEKTKKETLEKLKKEIDSLKFLTSNKKIVIGKNFIYKGKKALKLTGRLVLPYALSAIVLYSSTNAFGIYPFKDIKYKKNMSYHKFYDSYGKSVIEESYDEDFGDGVIITYYSKWEKINDNLYKRSKRVYKLQDIDEEELLKLLDNYNEESFMSFIQNTKCTVTNEKINVIDENMDFENSHIEINLYGKNKHNYIVDTLNPNLEYEIYYILVMLLSMLPTFGFRFRFNSSFNIVKYIDSLKKLKDDNKYDYDNLKKLLRIKEKNYERMSLK